MTEPIVSHGRGGQGNIGPDSQQYTDGGIHREGDPTATGGAYSSGRGGAGNIGSPSQKPVNTGNDDDIVPEAAAVSRKSEEPYHQGRGGQGNSVVPAHEGDKAEEKKNPVGLADKLKKKILGILGRK